MARKLGRGWHVVGLGQGAELVAMRGVNGGFSGVASSLQLRGHMMSVSHFTLNLRCFIRRGRGITETITHTPTLTPNQQTPTLKTKNE